MIYGYCRVATKKQNIERQIRNILSFEPTAKIIKEVFTGTKIQGRKELDKLINKIKSGDTIIFDSVSIMSRNAEEGFSLYEQLYNNNVNLVFLKERHIDTDTYKQAFGCKLEMTGTSIDSILEGINKYILELVKIQIRIVFYQAEKEVKDLQQRTKEGIETARKNGKQIGRKEGIKLTTIKSLKGKLYILEYSKTFGGNISDSDMLRLAGISRNTLYLYKRELLQEIEQTDIDEVKMRLKEGLADAEA